MGCSSRISIRRSIPPTPLRIKSSAQLTLPTFLCTGRTSMRTTSCESNSLRVPTSKRFRQSPGTFVAGIDLLDLTESDDGTLEFKANGVHGAQIKSTSIGIPMETGSSMTVSTNLSDQTSMAATAGLRKSTTTRPAELGRFRTPPRPTLAPIRRSSPCPS